MSEDDARKVLACLSGDPYIDVDIAGALQEVFPEHDWLGWLRASYAND